MIWNRESKKAVLIFLVLILAAGIVVNCILEISGRQMRSEYNELLAVLLGNVAEVYPDVPEEELIRIINDQRNESTGTDILRAYGVFMEAGGDSFPIQEHWLSGLRICANVLYFFLMFLCGFLFFRYLGKRQRRILDLTNYMEALNRGRYRLDIEENVDDELSGLRNEIYKTTVLLKQQATQAVEQRQALADSVANISHQLKTPLTSVVVLVDNLAEDTEMDEETRRHFLSEILRQITGMSWLVTAMLKLSRLEAGVVELEKTGISVKALALEAVQKLELAAEWKEITLSVNIPEGMKLSADRKWTVEALTNLIKNAIEYSPRGGSVEITGEENEIYTQIAIRDYGRGITQEEQKKLFTRFYNGSSVREDSMGIGLALAREIVERQNGSLSVKSGIGRGTVFTLKFMKK
ncbi:MAG: HAMP domain-containing histidine kinase [Lachnospiraceae bacterium]|nr:HAMP domain-containing histidine kinase [Lachnospiraceae bacterium]